MTVIAAQFDTSGVQMVADSRVTRLDGTIVCDDAKKLLRMPEILFGFGGCALTAHHTAATMAACEYHTLGLPLIKRYVEIVLPIVLGGLSKEFIDTRTQGGRYALLVAFMASHTQLQTVLVFRDGKVQIETNEHGVRFIAKDHLKENYMRETDGAKNARKFVEYAIASGFPGCGGPVQQLQI